MSLRGFLVSFLTALLLCIPWTGSAAQEAFDDELVKEFKRFYTPRRSVRERIEAIYVLKGADSVEATKALIKAFEDDAIQVRQAAVETVGTYKDPESVQFLIENYILNKRLSKKEELLTGVVESLGLMGDDAAAEPFLELYRRCKGWDLKRALAVAMGRLKSERCLPVLGALLEDKDPTLRIVALDAIALIDMPYASITPPDYEDEEKELCHEAILRVMGKDKNWQVRAAAIAAVKKMRFKEGIQGLIDRLRYEDGRLRGDAYEALQDITFAQYEDNWEVWQRFWDRNKETYEVPDYDAVMEARKKRAAEGTRYTLPTAAFAGIPTKSRKIIFVIDVSGSMETQVTEIDRFREAGKNYKSFQRLEIVKKELIETIENFDKKVDFNILSFATKTKWWKKDLVRSNILNKNSAKDFVRRLKPIGGASAGFKARAGLKAPALEEGKTNTYGALMAALGAPEDPDEKVGRKTFKNKVDTIYFLSDGQPTVGRIIEHGEIRAVVKKVNQVRKVIIHCIAIGDFQKDFMTMLAKENGGVYVDLGK